ncbi:MAG: hypothetical protein IJL22_06740 [Bacteroidales bacterium]|nr:hypothetical protein [Bacteroidales bacterium]
MTKKELNALPLIEQGKYHYDEYNMAEAWIAFSKAADKGEAGAYAYMGKMLYDGDWTPDYKSDVNGALDLWETGMDLGDAKCKELFEQHKDEEMLDPQEIEFENGDSYYGDVDEAGLPHGSGHMDYKLNGYYASYDGLWQHGKRCGKGHYHKFSSGGGASHSYDYKGEWQDDKEHGQGTARQSDETGVHLSTVSEIYTGAFREGKRQGHGVIVRDSFDGRFTDGKDRFEGEFEDGRTVGHGVWEYANGARFEGEFSDYGNKNGHGIYTFANGRKFEGDWIDDSLDTDSIKSDGKTPVLLVTEHHQGMDYNYTGRFLLFPERGMNLYENAATLRRDSSFDMEDAGIEILEAGPDSVSYKVRPEFNPGSTEITDTIRRGESKKYMVSKDGVATIYDEDYDYTIESRLEISCR